MSENSRSLGAFIREQRELARLSLRDLAQLTRVSNAYLSQVERGLHEPSLRVLSAVADALDVPLETMVRSPWSRNSAPPAASVEEAIRADAFLSSEEKRAMLTMYRSLIGHKLETSDGAGPTQTDPEL